MPKRWPLHPTPAGWYSLEYYVRQLAKCYGVSYVAFCHHALGIPPTDEEARKFRQPSLEQLQRLSDGTGVPVDILADMTVARIWENIIREAEKFSGQGRSENS